MNPTDVTPIPMPDEIPEEPDYNDSASPLGSEKPGRHSLLFENPAFQEGFHQVTCRLGRKWLDRLDPGDEILLKDLDENTVGRAEVTGLCFAPFDHLPGPWVAFEHDPKGRSRAGLAEIMKGVYGDDFDRDANCTAVMFEVTKLFTDNTASDE